MHDSHTTAAAPSHDVGAHTEHHPHVNYTIIFIALCVCTALPALLALLPLTRGTIAVLVLAVAVAKAQYVMRYFMHLKFEGKWKYVLLLPTAILACGIPLALAPDIGLHYYRQSTTQVYHESTARGGHGDHAEAAHEESAPPADGGSAEAEHPAH